MAIAWRSQQQCRQRQHFIVAPLSGLALDGLIWNKVWEYHWGPIEEEPEQDELIRYHKGNKPKTAFYNPGPAGSHFRHEARGTWPAACSPEVCAVGQRNGRFPHGTTAGSTVAMEEMGGSEFDLRE